MSEPVTNRNKIQLEHLSSNRSRYHDLVPKVRVVKTGKFMCTQTLYKLVYGKPIMPLLCRSSDTDRQTTQVDRSMPLLSIGGQRHRNDRLCNCLTSANADLRFAALWTGQTEHEETQSLNRKRMSVGSTASVCSSRAATVTRLADWMAVTQLMYGKLRLSSVRPVALSACWQLWRTAVID